MYKVYEESGKKYCEVEALKITPIKNGMQIHFICPFCSTFLKKNGKPLIKPRLYKHCHGLREDEYAQGCVKKRIPHCLGEKFPYDKFTSFKINITKNTKIKKK